MLKSEEFATVINVTLAGLLRFKHGEITRPTAMMNDDIWVNCLRSFRIKFPS